MRRIGSFPASTHGVGRRPRIEAENSAKLLAAELVANYCGADNLEEWRSVISSEKTKVREVERTAPLHDAKESE